MTLHPTPQIKQSYGPSTASTAERDSKPRGAQGFLFLFGLRLRGQGLRYYLDLGFQTVGFENLGLGFRV